jgi:hypothetical protein
MRQWQRQAAERFEENPQYADAQSQRLLKMPTQGLLAICEIGAALQRGEKIGPRTSPPCRRSTHRSRASSSKITRRS